MRCPFTVLHVTESLRLKANDVWRPICARCLWRRRSVYGCMHARLAVEPIRFRNAARNASALIFREPGASNTTGVPEMCDYSLQNVKSRPAKVGDKLTTRDFGTVTRGFAAAEDVGVAVCVLPGTELAFANAVAVACHRFIWWKVEKLGHTTAIFRQVNKNEPLQHHDALEFPDGRIV